jgi:hypothetical protein
MFYKCPRANGTCDGTRPQYITTGQCSQALFFLATYISGGVDDIPNESNYTFLQKLVWRERDRTRLLGTLASCSEGQCFDAKNRNQLY